MKNKKVSLEVRRLAASHLDTTNQDVVEMGHFKAAEVIRSLAGAVLNQSQEDKRPAVDKKYEAVPVDDKDI